MFQIRSIQTPLYATFIFSRRPSLTFQGLRSCLLDGLVDLIFIRQPGFGGLVLQLLQLHTLLQSPQLEHQVNLLVVLLLHHQKAVFMPSCHLYCIVYQREQNHNLLKVAELLLKLLLFGEDFRAGGFHFFHLLIQPRNMSCNEFMEKRND